MFWYKLAHLASKFYKVDIIPISDEIKNLTNVLKSYKWVKPVVQLKSGVTNHTSSLCQIEILKFLGYQSFYYSTPEIGSLCLTAVVVLELAL